MPRIPGPTCQAGRPVNVNDGTLCRNESPRPGPLETPLRGWDTSQKLLEAAKRTIPKLPADMREQFAALLSAENLATTATVLGVWATSQACGVGEAVDVGLIIFGVWTMGTQVLGVARDLGQFVRIAQRARTASDLEVASLHLARALSVIGVVAFAAMVTKGAKGLKGTRVGRAIGSALGDRFPVIRNPRLLAKHHGPVSEVALLEEIEAKGFRQAKIGRHNLQGMPENSDVYVRRIIDPANGQEYFETVRIDKRGTNPSLKRDAAKGRTPGEIQAADKRARQVHMAMDAPEVPSSSAMADQMNSGQAFKGDFTHWHHERFPASEALLEQYLKGPLPKGAPLEQFDSGGYIVPARK